jgi:hypothetical protein
MALSGHAGPLLYVSCPRLIEARGLGEYARSQAPSRFEEPDRGTRMSVLGHPPTLAALAERRSLRPGSLYSLATFAGDADNLARTAYNSFSQGLHDCHWHAGTQALAVKTTVPTTCTPPFPKLSAHRAPRTLQTRGIPAARNRLRSNSTTIKLEDQDRQ